MIVCMDCGKRKKVQNPKRPKWRCKACINKKHPGRKIEIHCFDCQKTIEIRKSKVRKSDYYICGHCFKHNHTKSIDIFQETGQIIIIKFNAAGEMNGFDIRFPTDEQKADFERAQNLVDCGIALEIVKQKLENGEKLNPHLN